MREIERLQLEIDRAGTAGKRAAAEAEAEEKTIATLATQRSELLRKKEAHAHAHSELVVRHREFLELQSQVGHETAMYEQRLDAARGDVIKAQERLEELKRKEKRVETEALICRERMQKLIEGLPKGTRSINCIK